MRKTSMSIRPDEDGVMILTVEGLDNYLTLWAEKYDRLRDESRTDDYVTSQWRMAAIAVREVRASIRKLTESAEERAAKENNGVRQSPPERPQDSRD